jgi:hypothetical protein
MTETGNGCAMPCIGFGASRRPERPCRATRRDSPGLVESRGVARKEQAPSLFVVEHFSPGEAEGRGDSPR